MTNIYPRESVEFQPILVTLDGVKVTTGVETAVLVPSARPTSSSWSTAYSLNGDVGVLIQNLATGTWNVWARITDSPEIPVINCGSFVVS